MDKSSWDIMDDWEYLPPINDLFSKDIWTTFDSFFAPLEKYYDLQEIEILKLLDDWDKILSDLGGDPVYYNWKDFRPLRLEREEDWSDWLVHIIASSKTGYFSQRLFSLINMNQSEYVCLEKPEREVEYERYRGDIVIKWKNNFFAHIEVKTGDPNLEKTYETSIKMRNKFHVESNSWFDFILLLCDQVLQWEEIEGNGQLKIKSITWENVAIAIRKSLRFSGENIGWKTWAYAFLGAIEQKLLGYPYIDRTKRQINNYYVLDSMLRILKEGMENEE